MTSIHVGFGSTQRHHCALTAGVREGHLYLVELVTDFPDFATSRADHGLVKARFNKDVATFFIFLRGKNKI